MSIEWLKWRVRDQDEVRAGDAGVDRGGVRDEVFAHRERVTRVARHLGRVPCCRSDLGSADARDTGPAGSPLAVRDLPARGAEVREPHGALTGGGRASRAVRER